MSKKLICLALSALLLAISLPASAQQSAKVPRIAYVGGTSLTANADRVEAFRQGLRELGYVEGKNIVIELRSADGEQGRLPALVAELVRLKIDIIVAGGPAVTRAAQKATSTIPIVMGMTATLLARASSPAWRGPAGTSLDCQVCLRR